MALAPKVSTFPNHLKFLEIDPFTQKDAASFRSKGFVFLNNEDRGKENELFFVLCAERNL